MNKLDNPIVKMTLEYALKTIEFKALLKEEKHYEIAKQLFRSGTSIGANVWESQHAERKKDFVHKLKIAAKEAEETAYWLLLRKQSSHLPSPSENQFKDLNSIEKVLSKIISTTKKSM